MIQPRTPPGVLELLPADQLTFQRMLDTIRVGYERFGFLPIETPVFELSDVLLTKSGGETEKQVYFVQSSGALQAGKTPEMAMRFDLTVPLARYVAQHENQLSFPFRRYQMQRVYRGERNQRGRYREFYQCDIDVIGKDTLPLAFDAEMPAVIFHVFSALNVGPFTIRINNRKLLHGLLESLGITEPAKQSDVLREIDKLDKVGIDAVKATLTGAEIGLSAEGCERVMRFISIIDPQWRKVLEALDALNVQNPTFAAGRHELQVVFEALEAQGVPEKNAKVDLSIARGLDYYTGTIYETVLDNHLNVGSVCSGGRYDNLATHYTKSKLPGVGLSIGATRLFFQLMEAGVFKPSPSLCSVYVTQFDAALSADYFAMASELRRAGINTELAPEAGKPGKQFKYADKAGIRFVAVVGPDEKANGVVSLKDLKTTQQVQVPRASLVSEVKRLLAAD